MLRHFLATLAYRTRRIVLGAPKDFAQFDAGHGVRKPIEIVSHMSAVLTHALSFLAPDQERHAPVGTWEEETGRFFGLLLKLDRALESGSEWSGRTEEQILQGPLADAMTHIGQLAMLRRMASTPIPKENFDVAPIRRGDVSGPVD